MANANNYFHINANASIQSIAPAAVTLYAVTINTKGAASNVLTLTDGNGSVIAVIDTTTAPGTLFYKVQCKGGLQVTLATGTAADVTICFG